MITGQDLKLIQQHVLRFCVKIDVYDEDDKFISTVYGSFANGSNSINSESSIRRTFNATIIPNKKINTVVSADGLIWINKTVKLSVGILDLKTDKYIFYKMGSYIFNNASANYDSVTNQLTLNCSDFIVKLDGTKNGQLGALLYSFPAYQENEETGEVSKYNIIREAVIHVLSELGGVKNYFVDDIGEYKAMPQYNENYEKYREENPLWNTIPYDLSFNCGSSVFSILDEFINLYPNYEIFPNAEGTFICQMVPSCYYDDISITNDIIQKIFISEDTNIPMTTVRNICMVWGKVIDTDYYTEDCNLVNDCYICNVKSYDDNYYNGDVVAVKIPKTNPDQCKINMNGFGILDIYDENTDKIILKDTLEENIVYVFKIKKKRENGEDVIKAYLLGHWQAQGMNVLTDGTISKESYTTADGSQLPKYSKEYFQHMYNCESIEFTTIPNSPFTVQKIGEILDVKTGGEFENITSDSLALARARWENWKNTRLTDAITITTTLIPFIDVNTKVSYKRSDLTKENQYIIKSINHDFSSGTTTWNMYRFYPLYEDTLKEMGTYKVLSNYSWGLASKYTWEQLSQFIEGGEY